MDYLTEAFDWKGTSGLRVFITEIDDYGRLGQETSDRMLLGTRTVETRADSELRVG